MYIQVRYSVVHHSEYSMVTIPVSMMVLRHITIEEKCKNVNELHNLTRANIEKEQNKWKDRYDQKYTKPIKYKVGEVVFLRRPVIHTENLLN